MTGGDLKGLIFLKETFDNTESNNKLCPAQRTEMKSVVLRFKTLKLLISSFFITERKWKALFYLALPVFIDL